MKRLIFWLCLVATLPARAQTAATLVVVGDLEFAPQTLTGRIQIITARAAPLYDLLISSPGNWSLVLLAGDLNSTQGTISSENLVFTAAGSPPISLNTSQVSVSAQETGRTGTLQQPLVAVQSNGQGRWKYAPGPGQFRLTLPAQSYAGSYRGTLTATLIRGLP